MKQSFLILIVCCLFGPLCHALTFTGTVTDAKTTLPVSGIYVYVQDSLGMSAVQLQQTTSTGAYSIPWPGTPTLGMKFRVWTAPACGQVRFNSVQYTGNATVITNINVCQGAQTYQLQGNVSMGASSNPGVLNLDMLVIGPDSTGDSVVLSTVSFKTINGTNGAFAQGFQNIPAGKLLLKASLPQTHSSYGAYLPTYANSSASWQTAVPLGNTAFISDTTKLVLLDTTRAKGNGLIAGIAISGGQPLDGRIIILTTGTNAAVGFTYTDANGHFSFNNLGLGTYKIYGDVVPKLNPALTMTLTATKPAIPNLIFEETAKAFIARLGSLGVSAAAGQGMDQLQPAPNPVSAELSIHGAERIEGGKQLIVRDLSGRLVSKLDFGSGQPVRLSAASWPAGMYFLQLQTSLGTQSYRVSKQ